MRPFVIYGHLLLILSAITEPDAHFTMQRFAAMLKAVCRSGCHDKHDTVISHVTVRYVTTNSL